jgi:hypothetical protein
VVLESKAPVSLSGLEGGVWVADASRKSSAQAEVSGDLTSGVMPEGLPEGPGRILRVAGRLSRSMWLSFEEQREDGKPGATPLYRLTKGAWKRFTEDWQPHISAWSKGRVLSMSTSSGRLKVKLLEPHTDKAPSDLPGARVDDEACNKTLKVLAMAALTSGEVFAAGTCRPGAESASRYVVIRWAESGSEGADAGVDAGTGAGTGAGKGAGTGAGAGARSGAGSDAGTSSDAGSNTGTATDTATDAGSDPDAGTDPDAGAPSEAAPVDDRTPGSVFIMPGSLKGFSHRSLLVRSPTHVVVAATAPEEGGAKGAASGAATSRIFRFDGVEWTREAPPEGADPVRALSGTSDGTLWMVTERAIFKKAAGGAWEAVPPPTRAFPEANPTWEMLDVWAADPGDVWISAKHTSSAGDRHVVLRLRAPKDVVRWP